MCDFNLAEIRKRLVASTGEHPAWFGSTEVAGLITLIDNMGEALELEEASNLSAELVDMEEHDKDCETCIVLAAWGRARERINEDS